MKRYGRGWPGTSPALTEKDDRYRQMFAQIESLSFFERTRALLRAAAASLECDAGLATYEIEKHDAFFT